MLDNLGILPKDRICPVWSYRYHTPNSIYAQFEDDAIFTPTLQQVVDVDCCHFLTLVPPFFISSQIILGLPNLQLKLEHHHLLFINYLYCTNYSLLLKCHCREIFRGMLLNLLWDTKFSDRINLSMPVKWDPKRVPRSLTSRFSLVLRSRTSTGCDLGWMASIGVSAE